MLFSIVAGMSKKFSNHYLNNIIFIDNIFWSLATESLCIYIYKGKSKVILSQARFGPEDG